jgi:pimeloyl-ACP methyl ester carboxylesterase
LAYFVLVHGSFHGPWCFSRIAPLLQAAGHSVAMPDLGLAQGVDLPAYASFVAEAVVQAGVPVILVGHSMGGLVISQAAELVPEHIAALVYISGLLLRDGETLQSFLEAHADLGVDDLVLKNMKLSEDGRMAHFPAQMAPSIFYNRCSASDGAWAASQLRAQPTAVYATPLAISQARFGSLPRAYVECSEDQAVSVIYQRQMRANTPCATLYTLPADHSPFLSDIDGLMGCLRDVAVAM